MHKNWMIQQLEFALLRQGDLDTARRSFLRTAEVLPEYAQTYDNLAVLSLLQDCPSEAEQWAERALRLDPDDSAALSVLAEVRINAKRYMEGIDYYQRVVRNEISRPYLSNVLINALMEIGDCCFSMGIIDTAARCYETLLKLHPESREAGVCLAELRKQEVLDLLAQAPNGLPVPPPHLFEFATGNGSTADFLNAGRIHMQIFGGLLERNGLCFGSFRSILDFGCSVGRLARHLPSDADIFGTDYNPYAIKWCRRFLPGSFDVNELAGALRYPSEAFDFILVFSVFTHLSEPLQQFWIGELERVLRPGGYVLMTVHGEGKQEELTDTERSSYQNGELVVREQALDGHNTCAVFHPEVYVREKMLKDELFVVDRIPGGVHQNLGHDAYLLKKA